ncbi:MAG: hypothetical protein LN413_00330 [Candidatus Thermoplasmatota archaeon]|nr:hypothetical protein [Candidatus Thermoplasmatota archaeon]
MPKRIHIPRGDPEVRRGVWRPSRLDGRRTAKMSCPACGVAQTFDDHDIDPNGLVSPSVQCADKKCAFHDYIALAGWP